MPRCVVVRGSPVIRFAAIGNAEVFRSAFFGVAIGRFLTGTNTPFAISSERRAIISSPAFFEHILALYYKSCNVSRETISRRSLSIEAICQISV